MSAPPRHPPKPRHKPLPDGRFPTKKAPPKKDGDPKAGVPTETPSSEILLNRMTLTDDGRYLALVKLQGAGVPEDVDLYFCKNNFVVLQIRVKTHVGGVVHDYNLRPDDLRPTSSGGVYELRDLNTAHEVQVKVQPALGILHLIKSPPYQTEEEVDGILTRLFCIAGFFYLLLAFQKDATLEELPLTPTAKGSTRFVSHLVKEPEALQLFCEKCPVFSRTTSAQAPTMRLADPGRPKSRGMVVKALLELKMLLVIAIEHFQADESQFAAAQLQRFTNFQIEIHEDVLQGGPEAQYMMADPSWLSLKAMIVGPGEVATMHTDKAPQTALEAKKALEDALGNLATGVLPRLKQKGQAADLELPTVDFSSAGGGAVYKRRYNAIWRRAIDVYLFDLIFSSQYPKTPAQGLEMIRSQWKRPDKALQLLCPSVDLEKAIQECDAELEPMLADKSAKKRQGVGKDGINLNPQHSTGLANPGENLCAANALLQVLFSTEPFREAVLAAPEAEVPKVAAAATEPAEGSEVAVEPKNVDATLEGEARQLVAGTQRLFKEMLHPDRASTTAKEVAMALYGKEMGTQQDCDELMHRLSLLLQDGLGAIPKRPYDGLSQAFRKLFVGATYEMRLKAEGAGATSSSFEPSCAPDEVANKQFLSILVQPENNTLTQALEDFTSWSSTGGSEVAWTQERFRTIPPFLCFASRQVSSLDWEESLNLRRFAVEQSAQTQKDCFERSKEAHVQAEIKGALEHIRPAKDSVSKANRVSAGMLAAEEEHLQKVLQQLESRLGPSAERLAELDKRLGGGSEESSVDGQEKDAYAFDLQAIVVYQGTGQFGHYIAFIRQESGTFLCFDDEQVHEHADAASVRAEIAERGSEGYPTSVRMVVYRRRGTDRSLPLELPAPAAPGAVATNGTAVNGSRHLAAESGADDSDAKRQRTG